jgi:hypothetical protein
MTAERWRQVEELFHQAATLAPEERDPWITGHCTGDEELERELRRMLAADSVDGATIERMIGDSVTDWLDRPAPGQPERVGPWRIVKPIGAGGMGAVYLAARDDDSYRQLAAVKILRAEQFAPGIHERFRQERQILAELDHPNIAASSMAAPPPMAAPIWSSNTSMAFRSPTTPRTYPSTIAAPSSPPFATPSPTPIATSSFTAISNRPISSSIPTGLPNSSTSASPS